MGEETTIDKKPKAASLDSLVFTHLPAFARFIRDNHLVEYVEEQLRLSHELAVPILKLFAHMSHDELMQMALPSHTDFLIAAEENRLKEKLEESIELWTTDRLGLLKREEVVAEDITLVSYVRKQALFKFLPVYTGDINECLAIVKEIEHYTLISDTANTNVYIGLLNNTIQEQLSKEKDISARLMQSEQHLLRAQEISHVGHWTWELKTGDIEWSDTLYKIYGIPSGTKLTFDEIIAYNDPEHTAELKSKLKQSKVSIEPGETYYRITLADGTRKILHAKTDPIADEAGNIYRVEGVIQDVTARQELIEKLQQSEGLFKQAQAMSHIGSWSWDSSNDRFDWSDELYRIYGVEPQSVEVSALAGKFVHPDDAERVSATSQRITKGDEPTDIVYRIVLPGGEVKVLHARGKKELENGKPVRMYGTVQDITEQRRAERQMKEYKDFIEKITNVTPSLITAYNIHTGRYTYINDAIEQLLGYPGAKIMEEGLPFLVSIMHPEDMAATMTSNAAAIEEANHLPPGSKEPILDFKYRIKNAAGEYRWFHTYGTIFERNSNNKIESVINISVDITDQEKAEQALHRKNIELQQSNKSLEEYAYVASHDLKEPLRKIATFCDRLLISEQQTLSPDGKGYLFKVITSAKHMQAMVNDLLTISTILGNKAFEECSLNDVFNEALQAIDHKIEERDAIVEVRGLPATRVVRSQFRQLFQNLVSNSLKFARDGVQPHITVSAKRIDPAAVAGLPIAAAPGYFSIEVADNGIGFDKQYATKIFAMFQRLHGKTEYEGTGIGLAICKKVAENHNGIIYAKGVPGVGATFTIIIPESQPV
ncbi:MAG: PAS domain-containing protein [Bacteroidota bacterium]